MTKKKSKRKTSKVKTKIVYREKKPTINTSVLKSDISKLEERKKQIARKVKSEKKGKKGLGKIWTGIRGGLAQASINAKIKERQTAIRQPIQLQNIKQKIEVEKAKSELAELRKKREVSFEDLGGLSSGKKQVNFKDLFNWKEVIIMAKKRKSKRKKKVGRPKKKRR